MRRRARNLRAILTSRRITTLYQPILDLHSERVLGFEATTTLEEMLDDRRWLLGEPSLADFGVFGSISPLLTVGEPIPRSLPHLADWARRVASIPRTAK